MPEVLAPKEPKEVKEWMKKIEEQMDALTIPKRKRDALVVWYGNKLPQYLWNSWKRELRVKGFTWQKFLTMMKFYEEDVISWYRGQLSWENLSKKIIKLLASNK